jgi:hypothetical protein
MAHWMIPLVSALLLSISLSLHHGPESPIADHIAIAAMATGATDPEHQLDKGIGSAKEQFEPLLFKGRTAKNKATKLTSMSVFSFYVRASLKNWFTICWKPNGLLPVHHSLFERLLVNLILLATQGKQRLKKASLAVSRNVTCRRS